MKRVLGIGLGVVTVVAVACVGLDSLTGPKTESQGGVESQTGVTVQSACSSPSPLPLAIFSASHPATTTSCVSPIALTAVFKVEPQSGIAPLTVAFNMCKSSDTDPSVHLHFHVNYADGSDEGGNACYYPHTYTSPGSYAATACVWDGSPASYPGTCQPFTITVSAHCTGVTFSNPRAATCSCTNSCNLLVDAQTTGGAACLSLSAEVTGTGRFGSFTADTQGPCPPGSPCTLSFNPVPQESFPPGPATVSGQNAPGSLTFTWNGCDFCC